MSVIALCAGKGSPGATFVAVNLAAAVARKGNESVLLDLDVGGGDVAAYLRLDPRRGLYPLLRMEARAPAANTIMRETEERGGVLAVCGFPEEWPAADGLLAEILRSVQSDGRWVLADFGRISAVSARAASEANLALVVARPDLISVSGAERAIRRLLDAGVEKSRIGCVVSGLDRRRPGDLAEVGTALGVPVLGAVPFDRRAARTALTSQTPLANGRLARSFDVLAAALQDTASTPSAESSIEKGEEVRA